VDDYLGCDSLYLLFILAGFEAYVVSLINFGYLSWIGRKMDLGAELLTHALCRWHLFRAIPTVQQLDFITQPDALATTVVEDVFGKRPLVIIAITFVVVAGFWILND